MKSIYENFKDITYGIKNLIVWFPVIWNDYNWDHNSIFSILQFKLKIMEKAFRSKKSCSMGSDKRADEMKICINILERLIKEEYDMEEWERHEKKWGGLDISFEKVDENWSKMNGSWKNVKTPEDSKQERKEFRIGVNKSEARHNYDLEYLFNYMRKHIRTWWD